jgi:(1->4)-alpha-D-glucan 1-alpha-D-glucosylmutase
VAITATYRLQLQPAFPLAAAREVVDYLAHLGASHVYSSPLLRARAGSTHGYDVVDPTVLDPELGTEEDLASLVAALRRAGMGLVLDIVPNHMAASAENPFWEDVLAHGPSSTFARWFDVDWGPAGAAPILLPVLGDVRSRVLARGELSLVHAEGRPRLRYFEHTFPLDPATIPRLLAPRAPNDPELRDLDAVLDGLRGLAPRTAGDPCRGPAAAQTLGRLAALYAGSARVRAHVDAAVAAVARDPVPLRAVLDAQAYRLVDWRRAAGETSYRRFFNISDLVGVRVEDPAVFEGTHRRILRWIGRGWLDGLRIDHLDGLWNPLGYLQALRAAVGADVALYVEKILSGRERLRPEWPVAGTTGYEFANAVEAIFIDPDGFAAITSWYRRRILRARGAAGFDAAARAGKRRIVDTWLAPDVRRLGRRLRAIVRRDPRTHQVDRRRLVAALAEVVVSFPVYRTYVDDRTERMAEADRAVIAAALARARRARGVDPAALDVVAGVLRLDGDERRRFLQRLQQTTGPVTAKGVEDTALYRWVPLVARNEVGGDPGAPLDGAVPDLHAASTARAASWPGSLLCATTHDTKRSADVRARLDVLSEIPAAWTGAVARWGRANRAHRRRVRGRWAPDANTEYLLYQSLVAIWPLAAVGGVSDPYDPSIGDVKARLAAHMRKAVREAKLHTSWLRPDPEFEGAVDAFVESLFTPAAATFLADVARFAGEIARPGLWNALARTLVQLTAPGVPDLYQGDELWNFTLADPDNRRPVDFHRRRAALAELEARAVDPALVRKLVERAEDGRIKLHVILAALRLRRAEPGLFTAAYEPLAARGPAARHVFAFARRDGDRRAVTIVPRFSRSLARGTAAPVGPVWGEAEIPLPAHLAGGALTNVLTGEAVGGGAALSLSAVLATCPVALLVG